MLKLSRRSSPRATPRNDLPPADPLLERIAWFTDNAIPIPGTRFRIGLDALLGLFPAVGDVLGAAIQVGLMILAVTRYNVPRPVAARMIANILLDLGVGSVPLFGDLFDAGFKANTRNVRLLRELTDQRRLGESDQEIARSSTRFLLVLGAALGISLLLLIIGAIALTIWIVQWIRG